MHRSVLAAAALALSGCCSETICGFPLLLTIRPVDGQRFVGDYVFLLSADGGPPSRITCAFTATEQKCDFRIPGSNGEARYTGDDAGLSVNGHSTIVASALTLAVERAGAVIDQREVKPRYVTLHPNSCTDCPQANVTFSVRAQ